MKYDIVFSVTVHESPECLYDLINNIEFYNTGLRFLIVLHVNDYMYNVIATTNTCVLINPNYYDKRTFTSSILQAHIDNFNFASKIHSFDFFMLLASNCMFVKKIQWPLPSYEGPVRRDDDFLGCQWRSFKKNAAIIKVFYDLKTPIILRRFHEGVIYSYELMHKIVDFIDEQRLLEIIKEQTCFEEILLPTIEVLLQGYTSLRLCKIYLNNHNLEATQRDVIDLRNDNTDPTCIVKRVPRRLNDPVRRFINSNRY